MIRRGFFKSIVGALALLLLPWRAKAKIIEPPTLGFPNERFPEPLSLTYKPAARKWTVNDHDSGLIVTTHNTRDYIGGDGRLSFVLSGDWHRWKGEKSFADLLQFCRVALLSGLRPISLEIRAGSEEDRGTWEMECIDDKTAVGGPRRFSRDFHASLDSYLG